jgi:hypothetical protein
MIVHHLSYFFLVVYLKVSSIVTCLSPLAIRLAVDTDYQHGINYTVYQTQE